MARSKYLSVLLPTLAAHNKVRVLSADPEGTMLEQQAKGQNYHYQMIVNSIKLRWHLGSETPVEAPDFLFDRSQLLSPGGNISLAVSEFDSSSKKCFFWNNDTPIGEILLLNLKGHDFLTADLMPIFAGLRQQFSVGLDFDLQVSLSRAIGGSDQIVLIVEFEEVFTEFPQRISAISGGVTEVDIEPILQKFNEVISVLSSPVTPIDDPDIVATLDDAIALQISVGSNWYLYWTGQTWGWGSDLGGGQGDLVLGPLELQNRLVFVASGGFLTAGAQLTLKFELADGTQVMPATPISNWMPTNPGAFVGIQIDTSAYAGQTVRARFSDQSTQVIRVLGLVRIL